MKIVVVGTGYVGMACVGFVEWGHEVVGVDIDAGKIERLNQGVLPIEEPGLVELVERGKQAGLLSFTTDLAAAMKGAVKIRLGSIAPSFLSENSAERRSNFSSRTSAEEMTMPNVARPRNGIDTAEPGSMNDFEKKVR